MGSGHSEFALPTPKQSSHSAPSVENPIMQTMSRRTRSEEEHVPIEEAVAAPDLSPKLGMEGGSAKLQRSRSCGNGYGCTTFNDDDDDETANDAEKGQTPNKQFEVRFDGDSDPSNPRSFSKTRKWLIVAIVSAGSTCVTCASSMYTLTYGQITKEFHISRVVATLGLSLFVMGLGLGPMILGPLSEFYGRRPIYVLSFAFFLIWLIPCAVAKNIGTELVSRFIDGFAGSGKALFWVISSCSRLLFDSRDMLQENMAHSSTLFAPQTCFFTQIFISVYGYADSDMCQRF